MNLENIKVGDKVLSCLSGGGFKTYSLKEVEAVNSKGLFLEGCDGDLSDDSVYGYDFDGQPFYSGIPGFKSTIVRVATDDDLQKYDFE